VNTQCSAAEEHCASFPRIAPIAEAQAKAAGWVTSRFDDSATLYADSPDDWRRRLTLKGNRWAWFQGLAEPLPDWAREPIG
jgi:hypothetical protein